MNESLKFRLAMIADARTANADDPAELARLDALEAQFRAEIAPAAPVAAEFSEGPQRPAGTGRNPHMVTHASEQATPAQCRFIARLRTERDTDVPAANFMAVLMDRADNDTLSKSDASELIDWLQEQPAKTASAAPVNRATERQIAFLTSLMNERGLAIPADLATLTRKDVSSLIDTVKSSPPKAAKAAKTEVPEGMHKLGEEIYKVQRAVHGSGNLYAKALVRDEYTGDWGFTFAPGTIRKLSTDTAMTLEEAKAFGALYGTCCVCGRTLTDEKSIEAGIGPVCTKKF